MVSSRKARSSIKARASLAEGRQTASRPERFDQADFAIKFLRGSSNARGGGRYLPAKPQRQQKLRNFTVRDLLNAAFVPRVNFGLTSDEFRAK